MFIFETIKNTVIKVITVNVHVLGTCYQQVTFCLITATLLMNFSKAIITSVHKKVDNTYTYSNEYVMSSVKLYLVRHRRRHSFCT